MPDLVSDNLAADIMADLVQLLVESATPEDWARIRDGAMWTIEYDDDQQPRLLVIDMKDVLLHREA